MTFSLEVPAGPLAEAALAIARDSESAAVANHSLRSFFFAELLAAHDGRRSPCTRPPGIAARRGLLAYLTREGIGIDFGRSIGGELLRERQTNGVTGMALAAASSPWGE